MHYVSADTRYIGTPEETERIKQLDCLVGQEPVNGWPLIRGKEFPRLCLGGSFKAKAISRKNKV